MNGFVGVGVVDLFAGGGAQSGAHLGLPRPRQLPQRRRARPALPRHQHPTGQLSSESSYLAFPVCLFFCLNWPLIVTGLLTVFRVLAALVASAARRGGGVLDPARHHVGGAVLPAASGRRLHAGGRHRHLLADDVLRHPAPLPLHRPAGRRNGESSQFVFPKKTNKNCRWRSLHHLCSLCVSVVLGDCKKIRCFFKLGKTR